MSRINNTTTTTTTTTTTNTTTTIIIIIITSTTTSDWLRAGWSGYRTWWGKDFPHPARTALGPIQPAEQGILLQFPESKADVAWR